MVDHPLFMRPPLFSDPEMTTTTVMTTATPLSIDVTESEIDTSAERQAYIQFLAKSIGDFLQELLRVVALQ
jgi:hypothetical protein